MQSNIKQQALHYLNAGQLKKARSLYEKHIKRNPRDPEALYMLGSIHGRAGNYARASDYFSKTLKLQPDAFVALCGLAASEKQLGNYEKAMQSFDKALKFQPGNTDILLEQADILLHQSRVDDAKSLLHEVLKSNPHSANAHHGLGEIHHSRRDLDTAIDYYKQALTYDNKRAITHNRLGFALNTKGVLNEAIEHFISAININPDFIDAYRNLAQCYLTIGQFEDALNALDKAIAIKPDYIDAIACKATVYEKQGEADKAYQIIEPWLLKKSEKHPGIGMVFSSISKQLEKQDEAIAYINSTLAQKIPEKTEESLHYELGRLLDKLGHHDEAFKHFETANELRPDTFRPAEFTAYMDAIKRIFNWPFMQNAPRASYVSDLPVFIVGMPRSGTSLTEQILDSHPEITGAGELLEIDNYTMEMSANLNPNTGFPNALSGISTDLLDAYAKRFEDCLRTSGGNSRFVTDKMPQNYIHLGLISLMFPKTKIIHCVRNPLDTCLSIYFQSFNESHEYASKLKNIGYYYLEYRRLMEHWKSVIKTPIHDIYYEQLVTEPENSVRELLEFLNVDWDPACLEYYESKRHVPTASYDQVRNKLYTSSINRWKHYEKHLAQLIDVLSPHIPNLRA